MANVRPSRQTTTTVAEVAAQKRQIQRQQAQARKEQQRLGAEQKAAEEEFQREIETQQKKEEAEALDVIDNFQTFKGANSSFGSRVFDKAPSYYTAYTGPGTYVSIPYFEGRVRELVPQETGFKVVTRDYRIKEWRTVGSKGTYKPFIEQTTVSEDYIPITSESMLKKIQQQAKGWKFAGSTSEEAARKQRGRIEAAIQQYGASEGAIEQEARREGKTVEQVKQERAAKIEAEKLLREQGQDPRTVTPFEFKTGKDVTTTDLSAIAGNKQAVRQLQRKASGFYEEKNQARAKRATQELVKFQGDQQLRYEKEQREYAENIFTELKKGREVTFYKQGKDLYSESKAPAPDIRSQFLVVGNVQKSFPSPNIVTQARAQAETNKEQNPVIRTGKIAVLTTGENLLRTGESILSYGGSVAKNPKRVPEDIWNLNKGLLASRSNVDLGIYRKQKEYLSDPLGTAKGDISAVKGAAAAGVLYVAKDPAKAIGKAGAYLLEAYTYGEIIKGGRGVFKFAKQAYSPKTVKAALVSRKASFRGGGKPTPKKSLKERKPKTKVQRRKETLNQAYNPNVFKDQQRQIVGVRQPPDLLKKKGVKELIKGVDFRTGELVSIQKGRRVAVESRRLLGSTRKSIAVYQRLPSASGKGYSRPPSQVKTARPKSPGGVVIVDKQGRQVFAADAQAIQTRKSIQQILGKREPLYKELKVDRQQLVASQNIRRLERLRGRAIQLPQRTPAPQKEGIPGLRTGKSTERLLKRLEKQKAQRQQVTVYKPTLGPGPGASEPPTVGRSPFSALSPSRKKRRPSFFQIEYTRPTTVAQAEQQRKVLFTSNSIAGKSDKVVTVYKVGGTYKAFPDATKSALAGLTRNVVSQFSLAGATATGTRFALESREETKILQDQDTQLALAVDTEYKPATLTRQAQAQGVKSALAQQTQTKNPLDIRAVRRPSKVQQGLRTPPTPKVPGGFLGTIRTPPPRTPRIPEPPKKPPEKVPRRFFPFDDEEKDFFDEFELEVRRRGTFRALPRAFRSFSQAFQAGIKETKRTAAASFRVVEKDTGQTVQTFGGSLPLGFRRSKREAGVIVQKRGYRISSAGEKREITRKGIFATKTKNIFGGR